MGRSSRIARTRDVQSLFAFFGLAASSEVVEAHRDRIASRFSAEAAEIVRLCGRLKEKEQYQLFREALRLAYDLAAQDA